MRTHLGLFLLIVGCMCESQASTTDTPVSLVRAQRAESNAAIAAHDAVRLRKLFDDDYHAIRARPATSTAARTQPLAAMPMRNSRTRPSSLIGARRHPLSSLRPGSGLRKQDGLKASGDGRMEPCEGRGCTLQCGSRQQAVGA